MGSSNTCFIIIIVVSHSNRILAGILHIAANISPHLQEAANSQLRMANAHQHHDTNELKNQLYQENPDVGVRTAPIYLTAPVKKA
jgi:hypothetical protein